MGRMGGGETKDGGGEWGRMVVEMKDEKWSKSERGLMNWKGEK